MKMNRNLLWIFALILAFGCATPQYAWRPAPEKTEAQAKADIIRCQRDSYMISPGYYGNGQQKFFTACMLQAGHTLEEVQEKDLKAVKQVNQ